MLESKNRGYRPSKVRTGLALDEYVIAALDGKVEDHAVFGLTSSEAVDLIHIPLGEKTQKNPGDMATP